jgi:hypothetical protein
MAEEYQKAGMSEQGTEIGGHDPFDRCAKPQLSGVAF